MLEDIIDELQRHNLQLRHELELAELIIEPLNELIDEIARLQAVNDAAILGEPMLVRDYSPRQGLQDSRQVLQGALFVPDGIGVVFWSSDEYLTYRTSPQWPDFDGPLNFVPFADLGSAIKAILLPHVVALTDMLLDHVRPI